MTVSVTSEVIKALLAEAARAHPREACGLLFGTSRAITALQAAANVHPAPETHFEIDPAILIAAHRAMRGGGPAVVGCYHSHPHGPAAPSAADVALAARDGGIWAIVGAGQVRFWRSGGDRFCALSYTVI